MKRGALALFAGALLSLWGGNAVHPRGDATGYPAHAAGAGVAIGARVLPADVLRKLFATDLDRAGYMVVELAIYPDSGKSADIAPLYFPKPPKKAKGPFELTWYAPSGKVHLSVPQPERK